MTLQEAIHNRDYEFFRRLLREGHDPDAVGAEPASPLCYAAKVCALSGDASFLRTLAEVGADLDAADKRGQTALWFALGWGPHEETALRTLAELGADLYHRDSQGDTVLDSVIAAKSRQSAAALVNAGFDPARSHRYVADPAVRRWVDVVAAAHHAAEAGDYDRLSRALDQGLSPDDGGAEPLLVTAARSRQTHLVQLLLERWGDPDVRGRGGKTPLTEAAERGDLATLRVLLRAGANVNFGGGQPLRSAASGGGYTEVIRELLAAGAEVGGREGGYTPLMAAAMAGDAVAARELLHAGAGVNRRSGEGGDGTTALYEAAKCEVSPARSAEVVSVLLGAGADPNVPGPGGVTPLMMACAKADAELVSMLLQAGADYRARDDRGQDWVFYARHNHHNNTLDFVMRYLTEQAIDES